MGINLETKEAAPFFRINRDDIVKGFITAALAGALNVAMVAIPAGTLFTPTVATGLWHGAVIGGIGYLLKQLGTNSQGVFLSKEPPKSTSSSDTPNQ